MKAIVSALLLLAVLPVAPSKAADTPATQPSTRPAESATEAAHHYIDLLRTQRGIEAVKTYWDFDAMFDTMFAGDMKAMSEADRAEMRAIMLQFLGNVFAKPSIAAGLTKSRFSDLTMSPLSNHQIGFDFTVTHTDGVPIRNSILLSDTKGQWQIYDGSTNGRSMCLALHDAYQNGLKRAPAGQMTPLIFLRQTVASGNH